MHRDKFPEKIPFRLTRMLVKAMEISGVEGTFRIACEHTLRVMRENRDGVMAVLEAFVYDPLISWRLFGDSIGITGMRSGAPKSVALPSLNIHWSSYMKTLSSSFVDLSTSGMPRVRQPPEDMEENPENMSIKENLNTKALSIISRVSNKLSGREFNSNSPLKPAVQVAKLIEEATNVENLCQCYIGWCPFW
jgi:serine/threonine-protein kinase mTOR